MFNFTSKMFEEQLNNLINNCGLPVSEAYYIIENAALKLKILRDDLARKEYAESCKKNSEEEVVFKAEDLKAEEA